MAITIVVNKAAPANHAAIFPYWADFFEILRLSSASFNTWFSFSKRCKIFKPEMVN